MNEAIKKFIEDKEQEIDLKLKEKVKQCENMLEQEGSNTLNKIDELSKNISLSIINQLDIKKVTMNDIEGIIGKSE